MLWRFGKASLAYPLHVRTCAALCTCFSQHHLSVTALRAFLRHGNGTARFSATSARSECQLLGRPPTQAHFLFSSFPTIQTTGSISSPLFVPYTSDSYPSRAAHPTYGRCLPTSVDRVVAQSWSNRWHKSLDRTPPRSHRAAPILCQFPSLRLLLR